MNTSRYQATGIEVEFEPGSRGRVLRNHLGITRVRDMHLAESQALEIAQDLALDRFDANHQFSAADISDLHALWRAPIYPWAGEYRSVDIGKGGFQFAHARLIQGLMAELERGALKKHTPCHRTRTRRLPWQAPLPFRQWPGQADQARYNVGRPCIGHHSPCERLQSARRVTRHW